MFYLNKDRTGSDASRRQCMQHLSHGNVVTNNIKNQVSTYLGFTG